MGLNEAMARRLEALRGRVALACARAGRPADAVSLVAVTKGVAPEQVIAACAAGLSQLGENRLQDAAERMAAVRAAGLRPCWHFIGHLQGNKVQRIPMAGRVTVNLQDAWQPTAGPHALPIVSAGCPAASTGKSMFQRSVSWTCASRPSAVTA